MGRLEQLINAVKWNFNDSDIEDVIKDCNLIFLFSNTNAIVLHGLRPTHFEPHEYEGTEKFYNQVLAMDPDDISTRDRLAELYLHQNKYHEAISEQNKILEKNAKSIRGRVGLGHSYLGMERYDDAIREYTVAIEQGLASPKDGEDHRENQKYCIHLAYCGLIEAFFQKGDFKAVTKYGYELKDFKVHELGEYFVGWG